MRRTPLRKVSRVRARELAKYWPLKKAFLADHPFCCLSSVCTNRSVDVHHKAGRGKNLNRTSTWTALCRYHHDWVHSHAKEARKLGLLT